MGCDIHSFAERKLNGKWLLVEEGFVELSQSEKDWYKTEKGISPFDRRNYSLFAFLADVRNYDYCEPISQPKGLPDDSEFLNSDYEDEDENEDENENENDYYSTPTTYKQHFEDINYHSHSYLTLKELLDFDYDKTFWNRLISKTKFWDNGLSYLEDSLAEEGEGKIVSYRENLNDEFFKRLEELKTLGEPENVRVIFWFDN